MQIISVFICIAQQHIRFSNNYFTYINFDADISNYSLFIPGWNELVNNRGRYVVNTVLRYIVISVNICHTTIPNLLTLKSLLLEKETQFFLRLRRQQFMCLDLVLYKKEALGKWLLNHWLVLSKPYWII